MTQISLPLQHSSHPQFLSHNCYVVPQRAEFQEQIPAPTPPPTTAQRPRKAPANSTATPKPRGRPAIVHPNSLKPYLQSFSSPGHALHKLPKLGDIVTGAVSLDYGDNAKPLGIKTVLVLLRRLDEITSEAIQEYMRLSLRSCTQRHAQRLAQCLRVVERASARVAKSEWSDPTKIDESDTYRTMHLITPCSEHGCAVCRHMAEVAEAWSLTSADKEATSFSTSPFISTADVDGWSDLEDGLFARD